MLNKEQVDKLREALLRVYIDAGMALDNVWDRSVDGFESQQWIIETVFTEVFGENAAELARLLQESETVRDRDYSTKQ